MAVNSADILRKKNVQTESNKKVVGSLQCRHIKKETTTEHGIISIKLVAERLMLVQEQILNY